MYRTIVETAILACLSGPRERHLLRTGVDVEKVVARGRFNRVVWERSQVGMLGWSA